MGGSGYRHSTVLFDSFNELARNGFRGDFLKKLIYMAKGSTIRMVSNCEDVTDWDISSSGNFNAVDETSDKRCDGSASMELVDAGTTKGTYVTLDTAHRPNKEDWTWANWLCMWIHDDSALRLSGELTFQIRNNGDWSDEINVPTLSNADMFELRCIDISSYDKGCVDGFRFVNRRGTGSSEKVYIDEIFITDLITGIGDGNSLATGPVFGPVVPLPIQTGSTIIPGDPVEWGVMGVATGTANDARIIGIACQTEAESSRTASDTVQNEVLVALAPSIFYARNDASGMAIGCPALFGADVVTEAAGAAASNAEYAFCMSLETSSTTEWASGDSAYMLNNNSTED